MFSFKYLVLLAAVVHYGDAASLPSYIDRCCIGPSMNACLLQSTNKALKALLKGDIHYNLPSFIPLTLGNVLLLNSADGFFDVRGVQVFGFALATVTSFSLDLTTFAFRATYTFPQLRVQSSYRMNLTNTPATGFGHANIVLYNVNVDHRFQLLLDSDGYPRVSTPTVSYTVDRVTYQMNGMCDAGNFYLNNSGLTLHILFGPLVSQAMGSAFSWPFSSLGDAVKLTDILDYSCSA